MKWPRPVVTPPVLGCLALFVGIAILVVTGPLASYDIAGVVAASHWRTPTTINLMLGVTLINTGAIPVVFALGCCALLWYRQGYLPALTLFLAATSGELLYVVVKWAFHRPRPDMVSHLAGGGWHSFPSGHAMMAPVIWSLALLLLARDAPRIARMILIGFAIIIPPLLALSRVVLGVHYPSDVLAGLALGTGWMLLWTRDEKRGARSETRP